MPVILLPAALSAWAAGSTLWFLKGDLRGYRRLRWSGDTGERRRRYRLLAARIAIAFGLPSLGGLVLLGRIGALATMPPEFSGLAAQLPGDFPAGALAGGAGAGLLIGGALAIRAGRRGRAPPMLGDVARLLPRERGELAGAALVAAAAAVAEEAFFRLLLPLLIALIGGGAGAGFAVSSLLFAALHRYQGWAGVAATGLFGLLLAWLYLASGALWMPVAVHLAADLNALVVRPLLVRLAVRRPRAEDSRTGAD